MKTLKDVKVGETATVARLHGEGPVKRRIMDMGITKGGEGYLHHGHRRGIARDQRAHDRGVRDR